MDTSPGRQPQPIHVTGVYRHTPQSMLMPPLLSPQEPEGVWERHLSTWHRLWCSVGNDGTGDTELVVSLTARQVTVCVRGRYLEWGW